MSIQLPSKAESLRANSWLSIIRIVVGLWFLKSSLTKLSFPLPITSEDYVNRLPKLLQKYASENPVEWYKNFLEQTAVPEAKMFATLTAYGETGVGLGLTLGLLTVFCAFIGLILSISYGLATHWMSPGQLGFHILLITCMIAFMFSRAGRTLGLDRWLAERFPRSPFW
jgi:uncharacterized membrane protein YphA (DoxX/SURF4 family)